MPFKEYEKIKNFLSSFLVVRHPFDRLVSAYINKLVNTSLKHDGDYFYKTFGKKIVSKYRNNDETNPLRETNLKEEKGREEPTFEEFVDYLLDLKPEQYNDHWKPISDICNICSYDFDFIVKFENFQEEFKSLITHFKYIGILPVEFETAWENKELNNKNKKNVVAQYIRSLSLDKIVSLYKIFKYDFSYFNYSVIEYIK